MISGRLAGLEQLEHLAISPKAPGPAIEAQ